MAERPSPTENRRITPVAVPARPVRSRAAGGTVIAVYGSRADVGVAAVATALAIAFRSLGWEDVGLAELDPRLASARAPSGATGRGPPTVSAERASESPEPIVIAGTNAALVKRADGVWTLAMVRPRAAVASDAKAVTVTIDAMRDRFLVNVAALGHQVNERTLAGFDAADRIVLLTDGAVASVRGTQRVLRLCRRLNYPDEKMCVVVNRYNAPGALAVADISAALRRETYWKIATGPEPDLSGLATKLLER